MSVNSLPPAKGPSCSGLIPTCVSIYLFSGGLCISSPWKAHVPSLPGNTSRAEATFTVFHDGDGMGITRLHNPVPGPWLNTRSVLDSDPRLREALGPSPSSGLSWHIVFTSINLGACHWPLAPCQSYILPLPPQACTPATAGPWRCPEQIILCCIKIPLHIVSCDQSLHSFFPAHLLFSFQGLDF